jgi:sarcosine oxidase subunit gamma
LASTTAAFAGRGLRLDEAPAAPLLHLEGPGAGAAAALGLAALPPPGRAARIGSAVLLPVGPGTFLLLGGDKPAESLTRDFAPVLDMTDAWTRLSLSGANAKTLLAKGSALDLHDRHFPVDACAAAGFARLRVVLWRRGEMSYDLLVGRSYALSLWDWLMDAAAEYAGGGNARGEP